MSRLCRAYPYLTKSQLAELLHISNDTLRRELNNPFVRRKLQQLNVSTHAHLLPPNAVKFLCKHFCISKNELKSY